MASAKWHWAVVLLAGVMAACGDVVAPTVTDEIAGIDAVDDTDPADAATDVAADLPGEVSAAVCPGGAGCPCQDDGECDDGDPCTTNQTCPSGTCTAGSALCDDNNPCTDDACNVQGVCSHSPHSGPCEDGDPCTVADTCASAACKPGTARACDDGNDCTKDVCQAGIGCVYLATDVTCIDENVCTFAGACHLGQCVAGKPKPCDDGSPCTWDTCMPETGCTSFAVPLSSDCTDAVHGGRCWTAVAAPLTWLQARAACHTWGGELAPVRSLPDNSFARSVATAACGDNNAWFGLSDHAQEGHWRWSDGGHGGYNNWSDGEPNNAGGSKTTDGEDFAVLASDGRWNDVDGATTEPCFVCARPLAISCDDPKGCLVGAHCQAGTCLPASATAACDDGNACTADACTPGQGCAHAAMPDASACGVGTCSASVCIATSVAGKEPTSCAAILAASAATPTDGLYVIDPDGSGAIAAFATYCDMHSDGGGWSLAMKIDGADPAFGYDGDPWLKPIASGTGELGGKSAVLPSAWALPVTSVRIGVLDGGTWRWLTLPVQATALQAIFAANKPIVTAAGMPAWEALLANGSLQTHCQLEGFNVATNSTALRIGIQGNNENDCNTVDSWIGLGAKSNVCGMGDKPTAGDMACYGGDNGDRAITTFAAILVR